MNSKLLFLLALTFVTEPSSLHAQSTAFTYQGRLDTSGAASTGGYDLRVAVFDAADGGNLRGLLTNSAVTVSNGLFTTTLDFGFGVFNGGPRWLEIGVRSNGTAAAFNTLAPRQAVLPAPYAFWSANASQAVTVTGTVPSSGLNGVYSNPVSFNNPANGFAGDGGGLNNVNAAQLGGRSAAQFWQTGGNTGANPTNGSFLGTTDNQPVELRANNRRALRLEPTADSANVIGGNASNVVSAGVVGAVIAGGGASGGNHNRVEADHAAVLGGFGNVAAGAQSVIGGGRGNIAGGTRAVVGGGLFNQALGFASVVVGGNANAATNNWSTIGGGADNLASGYASVIPGGINNTASANFTAAMGYRAKANHNGAFVWADPREADFSSTGTNQFLIRAAGGVGINTNNPNGAALAVKGNVTVDGQFKGGYSGNIISNGVVGGFIGGGGIAFGENRVEANFASVLGGVGNTASSPVATAMGYVATASGTNSTAMGFITTASGNYSTAMGYINTASGFASTAMGSETAATNNDSTAMGRLTLAGGSASTAMGYRAKANHNGSFVWADQQEVDFDSTADNQFSLRASGGVRFETGGAGLTVDGQKMLTTATTNQSLELSVNGQRAVRLEYVTNTTYAIAGINVIGGSSANTVSNGIVGAFIGGGGSSNFPNQVSGYFSSVVGGEDNQASGDYSTAMGFRSLASGHGSTAIGNTTIASGAFSTATGYGTLAGGDVSTAMGNQTIASGANSTAIGYRTTASGFASSALGSATAATNNDSTAMGRLTLAGGSASTALGYRARALHHGSFVWADRQDVNFDSTADNQFSLRASGGVRLANDTSLNFGNQTRQMINLWNAEYAIGVQADAAYFRTANEFMWYRGGSHSDTFGDAGGGSQLMRLGSTGNLIIAGTLSQGSDRHIKQDFTAVNPQEVLEKVAALSIQTWTYTNDVSRRHLGPVAQDFHTAFGLNGTDDKHIATVDADGVALAAIQGLNEVVRERNARIEELEKSVAELRDLVGILARRMDRASCSGDSQIVSQKFDSSNPR